MPRLIWSQPALSDVDRAYRFLFGKNKEAAKRAVKAIRSGVKAISEHPEIGRTADEMPSGFREWLIEFGDSGYVVLYNFDGNDVVILAVRHQKEVGYHA